MKKNDAKLYTSFHFMMIYFSFKEWDGVIYQEPFEQQCKDGLSNKDLYM